MPVEWHGEEVIARVRAAAMRGIVIGSELVKSEAIRLILSPPKTGRVYRRKGVVHQASAPGEAPANDMGRLANSITTEFQPDKLTGIIGAHTDYAAYLEYGTSKMEPRPYMRPALMNKKDEIEQAVQAEVSAELAK